MKKNIYLSDLLIYLESSQAKIGREKELETTLQRLRGENTDVAQEATEIRVTFQLQTSLNFAFSKCKL